MIQECWWWGKFRRIFFLQSWFISVLLRHLQGVRCPPQREGMALGTGLLSSLARLTLLSAKVQNREDGQVLWLGNGIGKICRRFVPLLEVSLATMGESLNYFCLITPSALVIEFLFSLPFFLFYYHFTVIQWGYHFLETHIIILLNNSWLFSAELGIN